MGTRFLHLKSSSIYFFDSELLIELMARSIYCSRLVVDQSLAPDQMSSKVHFLFLSCGVKRHRRDFPRSNFSVSQSHQTQVHFYRLSALLLLLPKTTSCLTFAFFSYQKDAFISTHSATKNEVVGLVVSAVWVSQFHFSFCAFSDLKGLRLHPVIS